MVKDMETDNDRAGTLKRKCEAPVRTSPRKDKERTEHKTAPPSRDIAPRVKRQKAPETDSSDDEIKPDTSWGNYVFQSALVDIPHTAKVDEGEVEEVEQRPVYGIAFNNFIKTRSIFATVGKQRANLYEAYVPSGNKKMESFGSKLNEEKLFFDLFSEFMSKVCCRK